MSDKPKKELFEEDPDMFTRPNSWGYGFPRKEDQEDKRTDKK